MNNENKQLEDEGVDWFQIVFGVAMIVALVLMAVFGHHWVSLGVGA